MPELTPAEEEAILIRRIKIVLGGRVKNVAPLAIDRNRLWLDGLAEMVGVVWTTVAGSADDWQKLIATSGIMTDQQVDLLIAYDEAGSLGGREWITSHASPREVWDGLKAVLDEAFPPLAELLRKVPPAILIPTLLQVLRSSTNSPSPAGPPSGAPKSSKPRSRRANSVS